MGASVKPDDLAWTPDALGPSASPVHVRWLGTAGFELRHGAHTLLIDPYVTRAPLLSCIRAPLVPDETLIRAHFPRADAIVLGHTHFDHALDTPSIAKSTGAVVFGSRSARALCRSRGVPERQIDVIDLGGPEPAVRGVGPFELRFHPSAHSKLLLGRVPFPGDIADCDDVPLRAAGYRCGAVFGVEIRVAGKTLFHAGSAELVDTAARLEVDLALMCVAGWTTSRAYPERFVRMLSPRAVLLSHWDNFLAPLDRGAKLLPAMQMGRLADRLHAAARDVRVGTVGLLGELRL